MSPLTFDITPNEHSHKLSRAGTLSMKRSFDKKDGRKNYDWALCVLDERKAAISNEFLLPNGTRLRPNKVTTDLTKNQPVLVSTGSHGFVKGRIMSNYSLVAMPGSKKFQRMCSVVLERPIGKFITVWAALKRNTDTCYLRSWCIWGLGHQC